MSHGEALRLRSLRQAQGRQGRRHPVLTAFWLNVRRQREARDLEGRNPATGQILRRCVEMVGRPRCVGAVTGRHPNDCPFSGSR